MVQGLRFAVCTLESMIYGLGFVAYELLFTIQGLVLRVQD